MEYEHRITEGMAGDRFIRTVRTPIKEELVDGFGRVLEAVKTTATLNGVSETEYRMTIRLITPGERAFCHGIGHSYKTESGFRRAYKIDSSISLDVI